jgi:putative membrane protein insertion efficiency factor
MTLAIRCLGWLPGWLRNCGDWPNSPCFVVRLRPKTLTCLAPRWIGSPWRKVAPRVQISGVRMAKHRPVSCDGGENDLGDPGVRGRRICSIGRAILRLPARLLILVVRLYQYLISPMLGRRCRFEPSCSEYFIQSVRKYGVVRGGLRGLWRICRCNPWSPGGYDPP